MGVRVEQAGESLVIYLNGRVVARTEPVRDVKPDERRLDLTAPLTLAEVRLVHNAVAEHQWDGRPPHELAQAYADQERAETAPAGEG
jgi:hypothetical protein